jgi:DNA repair protein SbcD/Mre11
VDALRALVGSALRGRLTEVIEEGAGPLALLSCRVRLTGRTPLHVRLDRALADLGDLDLSGDGDVRLAVERVDVDTRPALDLPDLARGSDAPALLARLLIDLEGDPVDADLVARAERAAAGIAARPYYAELGAAGESETRTALRRQASRLLDELVRQKEPA